MKVLHIAPSFYPAIGGIENVVGAMVRALRQRSIQADVLHAAPGLRMAREELEGSTVWRVPLFPHRLLGLLPGLRTLLEPYDILHLHDPQMMALGFNIFLQGKGKKKVLSTHGGYFHTHRLGLAKAAHWKLLAPAILRRYDAVLASSQSDWERFKTIAPATRLVANGVQVEKFLAIERPAPPQPLRWLYWGRLSRNKRIDRLIDTVAQARGIGLTIDLLIAGSDFDGLSASLQAQIGRLQLDAQVRLAGPLGEAELLRQIASRSVFISASEHEGFGLSIIEAMAAGMIVVCRNMAPLNGFVTPGRTGCLLRFDGRAGDLDLLRRLCKSAPAGLLAMQQEARRAAYAYRWEASIVPLIAAYEELRHENGGPSGQQPSPGYLAG